TGATWTVRTGVVAGVGTELSGPEPTGEAMLRLASLASVTTLASTVFSALLAPWRFSKLPAAVSRLPSSCPEPGWAETVTVISLVLTSRPSRFTSSGLRSIVRSVGSARAVAPAGVAGVVAVTVAGGVKIAGARTGAGEGA